MMTLTESFVQRRSMSGKALPTRAAANEKPAWPMYLVSLLTVCVTYAAVMFLNGKLEGRLGQMGAVKLSVPGSKAFFSASDVTAFLKARRSSGQGIYILYLLAESIFVGVSSLSLSAFVALVTTPLATAERRLDEKVKALLRNQPNDVSKPPNMLAYPVSFLHYLPIGLALFQGAQNGLLGLCAAQHLLGMHSYLAFIPHILSWTQSLKTASSKFLFTGTLVTIVMSLVRVLLQGLKMGDMWAGFKRPSATDIPGLVPAVKLLKAERDLKESMQKNKKKTT